MEFLDDDARPRFLFQSQAKASSVSDSESQAYQKLSKPFLFFTISLSCLFFALSIFYFQSEPSRSILIWLALSLLIGPFAPISITGGDVRVGNGSVVEFPNEELAIDEDTNKRSSSQRRSKIRRSEDIAVGPIVSIDSVNASERAGKNNQASGFSGNGVVSKEEKEWTDEDIEILKKQMLKNPVGKPRRWEVIAEAFSGRHRMENVIKKAKELGEKKVDDSDSYTQFLKKRKPVDKRLDNGNENLGGESEEKAENGTTGEGPGSGWSSGEDIALLNALKAFPKDVPMRWEKIAAAVPGKSKAACMKRVTELKKEFRSAKAAADG